MKTLEKIVCECEFCDCVQLTPIGRGTMGRVCGECVDKLYQQELEEASK